MPTAEAVIAVERGILKVLPNPALSIITPQLFDNPQIAAVLTKAHKVFTITPGQFNITGLDEPGKKRFAQDVEFYARCAGAVGLEHITSRLDNFEPKNPSQEQLLELAKRPIFYDKSIPYAGLYMWGANGVGKTHMAVAIAKECISAGFSPGFYAPYWLLVQDKNILEDQLGRWLRQPPTVMVLDDYYSGFGLEPKLVKDCYQGMLHRGGRLIITSSQPLEGETLKDIADLFPLSLVPKDSYGKEAPTPAHKIAINHFKDQFLGATAMVHVEGQSQRRAQSWFA